jgi:hypothetical protein
MNSIRSFTYSMVLATAFGATGCAVDSTDATATQELDTVDQTSQAVAYDGPHFLWQNIQTGEVSAWLLNGQNVAGTQTLTWRCGAADGCSNTWKSIDTLSNSILWHNRTSGKIQSWTFNSDGAVTPEPEFDWTCTTASSCATTWNAIGRIRTNKVLKCDGLICDFQKGLLWHNPTTGAVSYWKVSGTSHVTGEQPLSWKCGPNDGCSRDWKPILTADMNNDGNTDVVWHNRTTGVVSSWLIGNDGATVTGKQDLSWPCTAASGCASKWAVVGAADVNRDGNVDLTWRNTVTGEVSSWLLDGRGGVKGSSELSWKCDATCAATWKPLGCARFPSAPPR